MARVYIEARLVILANAVVGSSGLDFVDLLEFADRAVELESLDVIHHFCLNSCSCRWQVESDSTEVRPFKLLLRIVLNVKVHLLELWLTSDLFWNLFDHNCAGSS